MTAYICFKIRLIWTKDGKRFNWNFYRPASPPECANELWHTIDISVFDDETTIYTPWGTSSNQVIRL